MIHIYNGNILKIVKLSQAIFIFKILTLICNVFVNWLKFVTPDSKDQCRPWTTEDQNAFQDVVSFLEILKIIFSEWILPPTVYQGWTYLAFFRGRLIITRLLSPWVSWDGISDSLLFKTTPASSRCEPSRSSPQVGIGPNGGLLRMSARSAASVCRLVGRGATLALGGRWYDRPVSPAEAGWSVCTLHYCDHSVKYLICLCASASKFVHVQLRLP